MNIERLSTGIKELDNILGGGIPKGFFIAVVGEPGCGKTILCIHFIYEGLRNNEKAIYVTTEESRESIVIQASQFNMNFDKYIKNGKLVIIDALLKARGDPYSLDELDPEKLVNKIIQVKKALGYGHTRLVIDSLSAFWLDKPAMARKYSYFFKKILYQWGFTVFATSQYAITTSEAFGFGIEHIADGIIRFRKIVRRGVLKRYILVEKMRHSSHDLRMYEIDIVDGKGLVIKRATQYRSEDIILPESVKKRIIEASKKISDEIP